MTSGARAKRPRSSLDPRGVRLRVAAGESFGDDVAGAPAALALEDDKTPGRQLAVIGHAGGERENRLQFLRVGAGAMHQQRRGGTAAAEQFYGVIHVFIRDFQRGKP